jgi:hypothetical protein
MSSRNRHLPWALALCLVAVPTTVMAQRQAPSPPAQPRAAPPSPMPPVQFRCPASGTKVESRTDQQVFEWESLGAEADDPTLCHRKSGMWTTGEFYFGLTSRATTDGLAELRAGYQDLFSGRRTEFTVRTSGISVGGQRNDYDNTWKRLPDEAIVVAGRTVNAVVFQHFQQSPRFAGGSTQTLWYDPQTGVWVKRQVTVAPGNNWGSNWEVVKITQ